MIVVFFAVSLLASIVGSICGIGGGVIIKPVLDAMNVMCVSCISFLSGCTVLTMSVVSVYKNHACRQETESSDCDLIGRWCSRWWCGRQDDVSGGEGIRGQ